MSTPLEFDDEQGRHWTGWMTREGKIDLSPAEDIPADHPRVVEYASVFEELVVVGARPHDYTSTACQHALHERCRVSCKFCSAECRCTCHKGGQQA